MVFYVLLVIFLLANIIVAYRAARHSTGTIQDFITTKKLSTATLIMTLFATLMDGGSVGIKPAYCSGIINFFYPIFFGLTASFLGYFVFPKLANSKKYTLADFMGSKYGCAAALLTLMISTLFSVLVIAVQLKTIGSISKVLGNIPPPQLIIMVGLLVTAYTSFGGIRAVAMTDVLQCFIMLGGLTLFSLFIIYQQGGFLPIIKTFPPGDDRIYLYNHELWKKGIKGSVFFWSVFPTILISPPIIQRVLMASSKKKIKNMFASFGILYPLLRFFTLFVGLTVAVKMQEKGRKWPVGDIIHELCTNTLMQLAFVFALLAIIMSTMDSFLHALVSMWMYDFFRLLRKKKETNFIMPARWLSCCIGLGATCSVAFFDDLKIFDVIEQSAILFSVLTIPFLFAVLGLKSHAEAFWSAVIAFVIVFFVSCFLAEKEIINSVMSFFGLLRGRVDDVNSTPLSLRAGWFCSILCSTLVFLFVNYQKAGGFVFIRQTKEGFEKQSKYRLNFGFLGNPAAWATKKAKRYGRKGFLVGFFILLHFFIPHKLGQIKDANTDIFIAFLRVIGIFLAMVLWSKIIWYRSMRKYFDLFYYVTIFFCFAFVSTFTFLQDAGTSAAIIHLVVGLTTLAMLVDAPTFLFFEALGLVASVLTHYAWHGTIEDLGLAWLYTFVPVFAYNFFLVICITKEKDKIFLERVKRAEMEALLKKSPLGSYLDNKKQILQLLSHRSMTMRSVSSGLKEMMDQELENELKQEKLKKTRKDIEHLRETIEHALHFTPIHVQPIQLDVFLDRLRLYLKTYNIDPSDDILLEKKCKNQTLVLDPILFKNVLGQSLLHMHKARPNHKTLFSIQNTFLESEHNQRIPAVDFTITYEEDPIYDAEPTRYNPAFDYLAANNQQIIHAHYGTCKQEADSLHYIIPKDVKKLRPNINLLFDEDLENMTKLDGKVEQDFLALTKRYKLPQTNIKRALHLCKHYHRHQKRKTGEPFYTHPISVATILLEEMITANYTSKALEHLIIAALLHDTVEDTALSFYHIETLFDEEIANIVQEVTHLYSKAGRKTRMNKKHNLAELLLQANEMPMLLKLADRLHNMRTIAGQPTAKQKEIAQETLNFFIPVAKRLQQTKIEAELAKLCQKALKN